MTDDPGCPCGAAGYHDTTDKGCEVGIADAVREDIQKILDSNLYEEVKDSSDWLNPEGRERRAWT